MAKMDAFNLKRLKEEQEKALMQTDSQLEQWYQFRSDYVALRDRLKTLPNKTTHNVMVPFGPLAFMPGQLVHTNEILVLLGDNYFVDRSAIQAADIVTRRLKKLDENIQDLKKQREMLTPRTQITSEMIKMASGAGEQQEIVEEYDEEKEQAWRERHREYLRRAGEKEMRAKAEREEKEETATAKADADYWDILDQLEQQEKEREEMDMDEEQLLAEQQPEQRHTGDTESDEGSSSLDESEKTEDEEEDSADIDEEEEEEEDVECPRRKIITFSHTKQDSPSVSRDSAGESNTDVINSPADLYRFIKTTPRSILKTSSSKGTAANHSGGAGSSSHDAHEEKKVTFGGEQRGGRATRDEDTSSDAGTEEGDDWFAVSRPGKLSSKRPVQAFTDTVVEREVPAGSVQLPRDSSTTSTVHVSKPEDGATSTRPVSKFCAARQKTDVALQGSEETEEAGASCGALQGQDVRGSSVSRPVSKFRASRMKQGGGS
ncbi:uncharacterized protein LOC143300401 [Babylonia areolata]|uniref:uncharacterized protein LOC143300401 n=1 Tax=Babylonia areolata TaxID=304850 RepID=UPI003FD2A055